MNRSVPAVAVALAAAATAAAVAVPIAGAAPKPLSFVSITKQMANVSTGFILADVDYDAAGRVIGSDAVNCRGNSTEPCAVSVVLAGGTLYLSTTLSRAAIHGRIVAGTGEYKGATGSLAGKAVSASKTDVTVTFTTV